MMKKAIPLLSKDHLLLQLKIGLHVCNDIIIGWPGWYLRRGSLASQNTQFKKVMICSIEEFFTKILWFSLFSISELAINFSGLLKKIVRTTLTLDRSTVPLSVRQYSNMSWTATIITKLLSLSPFKHYFLSNATFIVLSVMLYILTRPSSLGKCIV